MALPCLLPVLYGGIDWFQPSGARKSQSAGLHGGCVCGRVMGGGGVRGGGVKGGGG